MIQERLMECFNLLRAETHLEEDHAIVITNITTSVAGQDVQYCIVIDPHYLMFSTRELLGSHQYVYDFKQSRLLLNRKAISIDELPELLNKVYRSISDLRMGLAKMYTKPAHTLSPKERIVA